MAGINRLGKGPAKPGTMRPQDPNKYKTTDIFSEGTEGDKDYQRMVQDIEDTQQNHMGWLFSRGAFDKGDLLYLRDEEEKRRFAEQELRDSELRSFARMRQRAEGPKDDGLQSGPSANNFSDRSQGKPGHHLIRIKPTAKAKRKETNSTPDKRIKLENGANEERTIPREVKQEDETGDMRDEEGSGLAGMLGGYGSGSDDEEPPVAKSEAEKDAKSLPLPDITVKNEVKLEPRDSQLGLMQAQGLTQIPEEVGEDQVEEVDYSDDSESSSQ